MILGDRQHKRLRDGKPRASGDDPALASAVEQVRE